MSFRKHSNEKPSDDDVCTISAKKYTSNRRYFYVIRRSPQGSVSEDVDLYHNSVVSSSSTRTSILTDSGSSTRPFLLDVILKQIPWRPYRSQRSTDEESDAFEPPDSSQSSFPEEHELFEAPECLNERYEIACFKSRDCWKEGRAPKIVMDLHELLYISSFKQKVDRKTVQHCLSLCGERCGLTFWVEDEHEWRRFREKLNDIFLKAAKPVCHRIEYACNVVIKHKGLAKVIPGPSVQPVLTGSYRLLLMDSKMVFVRDSIARPVLTIYYQWIRRMVRQMQFTMMRRAQSVFSLELGHMSDTGEGFLFFRVVDEPSQRGNSPTPATASGSTILPESQLSEMLLSSMKDNSLSRQLRRSARKSKSRSNSSRILSENSSGSSCSTDGTSTLIHASTVLPSIESREFGTEQTRSRYLTMEVPTESCHTPTSSPPPSFRASEEAAAATAQDLYVDYYPAVNFERSCSTGASSDIRPLASSGGPNTSKTTSDLAAEPWCSGNTNPVPMVAALSLVTTSSVSTNSQGTSSVSSLANQLEKSRMSGYELSDDYGSLHYDMDVPPFRQLS